MNFKEYIDEKQLQEENIQEASMVKAMIKANQNAKAGDMAMNTDNGKEMSDTSILSASSNHVIFAQTAGNQVEIKDFHAPSYFITIALNKVEFNALKKIRI